MPYVILNSAAYEDRKDVVVVSDVDGSARVFEDHTEAREWAEENLNFWYKVVRV